MYSLKRATWYFHLILDTPVSWVALTVFRIYHISVGTSWAQQGASRGWGVGQQLTSRRLQYPNLLLPSSPVSMKEKVSLYKEGNTIGLVIHHMIYNIIRYTVISWVMGSQWHHWRNGPDSLTVTRRRVSQGVLIPGVVRHWTPVFGVWETELRDGFEPLFRLPHLLGGPLQLWEERNGPLHLLSNITSTIGHLMCGSDTVSASPRE